MRKFGYVLSMVLTAGASAAETTGQEVFLEACAGCHGEDAHGNGPKAAMLTQPVPDLTLFAARNDGTYDRARVVRLIDGREGLAAHGGPMPMFGGLLTGPSVLIETADGGELSTTEPILAIVDWLETQQAN